MDSKNAPAAVWGGGISGSLVVEHLMSSGIRPEFVVDSDEGKWGATIRNGVPIVSPDSLSNFSGTLFVACAGGVALQRKLQEFSGITIDFEVNWKVNSLRFIPYWTQNSKKIKKIRSRLSSANSQALLDLVCRLGAPDNETIRSLNVLQDYFQHPRVLANKAGDIIICGANVGEELESAMSLIGAREKAILFEPNPESAKSIKSARVYLDNPSNFQLFEKALGSKKETISLTLDGISSRTSRHEVSSNPDIKVSRVALTTIDHECEAGRPVQMITLDVEGDELEVLKGSKRTIEQWSPTLAISVYHRERDLFQVVDFLDSTSIQWDLELACLDFGVNDLTLFAFPRN